MRFYAEDMIIIIIKDYKDNICKIDYTKEGKPL